MLPTVALPTEAALTLLKFAPLIAGSVAGNLASGSVPEFKFEAEPAVKLHAEPVVYWISVVTLAAAIVPEDIFDAFNEVRFAPLTAGNVDGKRASGTVPEVKLFALKLVRSIDCQLLSPLKKLELEAVPLPSLAVATVPEAKFEAFNAVKVEPFPINVLPLAT